MIILIVFKILAILFNTADYFLTIYALKQGAKEANPIMRILLKYCPTLAFILKCIIFNLYILTLNFLSLYIAVIIFGLICINNLLVIWRIEKC